MFLLQYKLTFMQWGMLQGTVFVRKSGCYNEQFLSENQDATANSFCQKIRMLQRTVFVKKSGCCNEQFFCQKIRMLQRTVFVKKIWMLQRTVFVKKNQDATMNSFCQHRSGRMRNMSPPAPPGFYPWIVQNVSRCTD